MNNLLYLTADSTNTPSGHGGGSVVYNELTALQNLGNVVVLGKEHLDKKNNEPWGWDEDAFGKLPNNDVKLCHGYAGTFSRSIEALKKRGTKITWTCAAHRIEDSRKAHEDLGIPYNYPHLTDPELWKRYSQGYREADILIVPSKHSETVVREQGCVNRVEVVPHGCSIPKNTQPIPKKYFCVGYLGSFGADKGVKFLLQAWKKLNYKDGLLILGGKDSTSDWAKFLIQAYGGGSIQLMGWVDKLNDFYDKVSLYVQPSATEGFGIEVLEAHAHGRCCICSDHAGAVDLVHESCKFPACNVDALAEKIDEAKKSWDLQARGDLVREQSRKYSWGKIQERYIKLWEELLG